MRALVLIIVSAACLGCAAKTLKNAAIMPTMGVAATSGVFRHYPWAPITNVAMTFYARRDGSVEMHEGGPTARDIAVAGGFWSMRKTWVLQSSGDLELWATVSETNAPGAALGVVVVTNGWEQAKFYRIGWR